MLPSSNQPSTSTAESTNDGKSGSYQVLNISNVNAQKEVVLNDEQLLGLIQLYPFLYNPRVKPYKDNDFDKYAWEQITKAFNRTYEPLERNVRYTTAELQARWNVLQPIVRSLSKISNIKSLPDSLRQTVIKMSVPMDEQSTNEMPTKPLTVSQKIILQNIGMVKRLPLEHRRRLEAEIMEIILNGELDSRATIKLGTTEQKHIEKEYYDFLKAAGLEEINVSADECILGNLQQPQLNGSSIVQNTHNVSNNDEEITVKSEQPDLDDYGLLQPLPDRKWVPLSRWQDYVRKCRVRVKRSNLEAMMAEDEIPLARIKREKIGL